MARAGNRTSGRHLLDIQATAQIGASAKYEVQKTITEQVPEDVTRAKSAAWLTMLSPFTQWAGLIGDKLAHKRALLRIQQEETLLKIMQEAAPKLANIKSPIEPIPAKFLIPFLECASLEDPDSGLIRMWANLLVSSAKNYHGDNVYYVHLISQMSSLQARLFESIIGPRGPGSVLRSMEQNYFLGPDFLSENIREAFQQSKRHQNTLSQVWNLVSKTLNNEGVVIEHIDLGESRDPIDRQNDNYTNGCPSYSIYEDEHENDYAILRGLGLVEYVDTGYFEIDNKWKIKVMAHYVSSLGLRFAEACGVGERSNRRAKH
jgi:hypothetical protein